MTERLPIQLGDVFTWLFQNITVDQQQWLREAIDKLNPDDVQWESEAYVRLVPPESSGFVWNFSHNLQYYHPQLKEIVLDVLADGRIGGIEFPARVNY